MYLPSLAGCKFIDVIEEPHGSKRIHPPCNIHVEYFFRARVVAKTGRVYLLSGAAARMANNLRIRSAGKIGVVAIQGRVQSVFRYSRDFEERE